MPERTDAHPFIAFLLCLAFSLPLTGAAAVPVRFQIHKNELPAAWWRAPYSARYTPLANNQRRAAVSLIRNELTRYPEGFLQKHLVAVHTIQKLSFYNKSYGGTYAADKQRIYCCFYPDNSTFSRQVLHEEFSSLLFKRYKSRFPLDTWTRANAPAFRYGKGGIAALFSGEVSQTMTPVWFRQGFLYQYATSSLEEDFNSVISNLFYNAPRFINALRISPILRQKTKLAIRFYQNIDPRFTLKHFDNISGGRLAATLQNAESKSRGAWGLNRGYCLMYDRTKAAGTRSARKHR